MNWSTEAGLVSLTGSLEIPGAFFRFATGQALSGDLLSSWGLRLAMGNLKLLAGTCWL